MNRFYILGLARQIILLACIGLLTVPAAHAQYIASTRDGSTAISRFLMNFGRFIEWPDSAFSANPTEFRVCVLGDNELGVQLERTLRNRKAGDREFSVHEIAGDAFAEARQCQIVYVSSSEEARAADIIAAMEGSTSLTVSEIEDFARSGGMIGLRGNDFGEVAIQMNRGVIDGAGLNVSEQLHRAIQ